MKEIELKVNGMHCEACSKKLTNVLNDLEGVKEVKVSLSEKNANIKYDDIVLDEEEIIEEIENSGFEVIN